MDLSDGDVKRGNPMGDGGVQDHVRSPRRAAIAVVLVAVTLVAAACANGGETVVADGGGTPTPGGGDRHLFVSIEVGGGFVPAGYDFRALPQAVVLDDGTSFSPGLTAAIYPSPAVLPVVTGRLPAAQLARIVAAADEAGLLGPEPLDVGEAGVADAATTTITVVVGGTSHVTAIDALGMPDRGQAPGLGRDQLAARNKAQAFVELVAGLVTDAEAGRYEAVRYRVLPTEVLPPSDASVVPNELDWPFPDVALTNLRCTAITGDRVARFRAMLTGATEITRWRTGPDQVHDLVIRPVLPHEPDCPESPQR
jgi:hypothetical protein